MQAKSRKHFHWFVSPWTVLVKHFTSLVVKHCTCAVKSCHRIFFNGQLILTLLNSIWGWGALHLTWQLVSLRQSNTPDQHNILQVSFQKNGASFCVPQFSLFDSQLFLLGVVCVFRQKSTDFAGGHGCKQPLTVSSASVFVTSNHHNNVCPFFVAEMKWRKSVNQPAICLKRIKKRKSNLFELHMNNTSMATNKTKRKERERIWPKRNLVEETHLISTQQQKMLPKESGRRSSTTACCCSSLCTWLWKSLMQPNNKKENKKRSTKQLVLVFSPLPTTTMNLHVLFASEVTWTILNQHLIQTSLSAISTP